MVVVIMASTKSRNMMATNDSTNPSVAARPTPSAPARLWNPRWQQIRHSTPPNTTDLASPDSRSNRLTNRAECSQ